MSDLSNLIAFVQEISSGLQDTQQGTIAFTKIIAQKISAIMSLVEGTNRSDIKECLVEMRNAIKSLDDMSKALINAVESASSWIEKVGGDPKVYKLTLTR